MKKTKIIATQGPATCSKEKILELYNSGANIIRFNFSHVNYQFFADTIKIIKELNESGETNLSLLLDTKGPEIRTKDIDEPIYLSSGENFVLTSDSREDNIYTKGMKLVVCNYEYIVPDLKIGDIVDIDSGLLKAEVIKKNEGELIMKSLNAHKITGKRHLNLPGINIKLPGITDSDKEDIKFGIEQGFDYIAMSFVRNKENILELKDFLKTNNAKNISIISKIESEEALNNIDEIIENSDGLMIARGDLGVEVPYETLPLIQKTIADKCKKQGKFFIVATQMLESMIVNPIPTRAEVTDIFNACMQKADATMLSGETAAGDYPIEAVKQMKKVIKYTESQIKYKHEYFDRDLGIDNDKKLLVKNAVYLGEDLGVKSIIVFTNTGFMGKTIAAFRPNLTVYTFSFSEKIRKKLNILFCLKNFVIEKKENDKNVLSAIELLKNKKLLSSDDKILVIYDMKLGNKTVPNIQIRTV